MATECGIEMEKSVLLPVSGANHFLTERFDRKDGKKVHSATLRSLSGEVTSYDELFKVCRILHLPYHDIEQLYLRVVFNYLAGVTDDHDKNFSFIMSEDGTWRLDPAYDVTFTVNYKNRFIGDRHAMSIAESDKLISRGQLIRLASENDVRNADSIITRIAEVLQSFREKGTAAHIDGYHLDLISEYIREQNQII